MNEVEAASAESSNVCESLVMALAEAEGVDPVELTPPLYEVIDTDALDSLFAPTATDGRTEGEVTFHYDGYDVTVCGDGYVSVEERDE